MSTTHAQDTDEPVGQKLIGIGKAAKLSYFSVDTIRRYSDSGVLATLRTPGGQRRFRVADVLALNAPASPSSDTEAGASVVPAQR